MKKLVILLMFLTPFVFNSQKAFAGAGQSVVAAAPAPIVSAPIQTAVTANGDTVAICEIVKEKDPCEKCECEKKSNIYKTLFWILVMFIVISVLF